MSNQLLRSLPSIERLLERPLALRLASELSRERVRDLLREITDELRIDLSRDGFSTSEAQSLTELIEDRLTRKANESSQSSLRRVINATGVILHTNLGRAPLARQAVDAVA